MLKVYLAGPITGLDPAEATGWRDYVTLKLPKAQFTVLNPLRGKALPVGKVEPYDESDPKRSVKYIFERARFDVKQCDIFLAYLVGPKSLGTMAELAWAYDWDKPTVGILTPGSNWDNAFVKAMVGFECKTIDQAIETIFDFEP